MKKRAFFCLQALLRSLSDPAYGRRGFWALISWPTLGWAGHKAHLFLLPPTSDPALVSQGVVLGLIDSIMPLSQRTFFLFSLLSIPQISCTDKKY